MKKLLIVVLIIGILLSTMGCVGEVKIDGKEVKAYGFMNKESAVDGVEYKISFRNAFWSAVALETIIAPVLYFMFYVWVPVEVSDGIK